MTFDPAFHGSGIGGSDIAAVVGLSKWKSPLRVYLEKTHQEEPQPESEAFELGHALERVVLDLYAKRQGVRVLPAFHAHDPVRPWRRVQLDGEVAEHPIGLEAKTAGIVGYVKSGAWGDEGTDQIPQEYLCQCHWQLAVWPAWECVHVPALIAGRGLQIYIVERNAEFEAWLGEKGDRFWHDHVLARVPPELDDSAECARWLARIHPMKERAELLESTPAIDELMGALALVRKEHANKESQKAALENHLRAVIGEARGVRGEWGVVTWTPDKNGRRTLRVKLNDEQEEAAA